MVSVKALQIIAPVKHKLELQLNTLIEILEAENIKDRNVAIISIAGAFRKGKSFLLNFFLRYLYAQYKKHDVSNWIGEGQNGGELHGFKSRGGRKPETTGIWMWSEIFTHDFENGEKVAIILLDTQGIFDNQSSMKYCTATFAISMMLASVQCYNVSQNIQEDDLQHLELFTEYGRLALQQSNETPFQKLIFIVRDWDYADDDPYGYAQNVIDEILAEYDDQPSEMHGLRTRIKSSFDHINAFVMPHPGFDVSRAKDFSGDLNLIDPDFVESLKELVPSIFAPENLIPKKIGGQKVQARHLVTYLQTYVDLFNGRELPEPRTVLMSTAATSNLLLYTSCLNTYVDSMQKSIDEKTINEDEPYFDQFDLQNIHELAKEQSLLKFHGQRKLGGDELIGSFLKQLVDDINAKYKTLKLENDRKRKHFYALAKAEIHVLYIDSLKVYIDSMQKSLCQIDKYFGEFELLNIHGKAQSESLLKFGEQRKRGGDDLIESFTNKLLQRIEIEFLYFEKDNDRKRMFVEELKNKTEEAAARAKIEARAEAAEKAATEAKADMKNTMLYTDCLNQYKNSLQKSINEVERYYYPSRLAEIHEDAKQNSLSQFEQKRESGGQEVMLESRLETDIDTSFIYFDQQNDRKRKDIEAAESKADLERKFKQLQDELNKKNEWCSIS